MRRCSEAAVILILICWPAASQSATRDAEMAAITKLEQLCDRPDDHTPAEIEEAAEAAEQAIRAHASELKSPRVYAGDMWSVAHKLASRNPKLSLRFAQKTLQYIDANWATTDIHEAERYRIWATMLEAYSTAGQWEPAAKISETLLRAIRTGAAPAELFSGPGLAEVHARYARALAALGRTIEAADQRRLAAEQTTARPRDERAELVSSMIKVPAPDFLLRNLNGQTVGVSDFRGKPLVLVFWATWCKPCHPEMDGLNKMRLDANLLTVAMETSETDARRFIAERGYKFPILLGDKPLEKLYEVEALPKVFVLDPSGNIRFFRQGTDREFEKHLAWMVAAVSEQSQPVR